MALNYQKVTIIKIRNPVKKSINHELQWLGASLGLFNLRDREKSCYRIFVELLKSSKGGDGISSDSLAYKSGLSRGTVIHHINKMMDSGIVINKRKKYLLRADNLPALISKIEEDMKRILDDIKEIAKDIDGKI